MKDSILSLIEFSLNIVSKSNLIETDIQITASKTSTISIRFISYFIWFLVG